MCWEHEPWRWSMYSPSHLRNIAKTPSLDWSFARIVTGSPPDLWLDPGAGLEYSTLSKPGTHSRTCLFLWIVFRGHSPRHRGVRRSMAQCVYYFYMLPLHLGICLWSPWHVRIVAVLSSLMRWDCYICYYLLEHVYMGASSVRRKYIHNNTHSCSWAQGCHIQHSFVSHVPW